MARRWLNSIGSPALALVLALGPVAPAQASAVQILSQPQTDRHSPQRMTLRHADGELSLLLTPSQATAKLAVYDSAGRRINAPAHSFSGVVENERQSWVRLTSAGNRVDGVIAYRGLRYRLLGERHRGTMMPLALNHHHPSTLPVSNSQASTSHSRALPTTRKAAIAVVVDSQFNRHHNGRGLEKALSILNAVDGIYRAEFGLALSIERAIVYTDPTDDPHRHGPLSTEHMLRRFRDYRMAQPLLGGVCLVHLFTGNQHTDRPVGLAWIDTACRSDGYDVSLSTPYRHEVLLAAHEIAHNLGAEHDSATYCPGRRNNIMWKVVSSRTSQHFSSCTRAAVARSMAKFPLISVPDIQAALGASRLVPASAAEQ